MENTIKNNDQELQSTSYNQKVPVEKKLKGAWQILKDAWDIYRSRFRTAIGIMLIPVIISVILTELNIISVSSSVLSQVAWISFVKIAIWIVSLFFDAISISALLFSVKNETGIIASYRQSFKSIFSYILVVILGILVITGGYVLLIIPGIIFSVWFSLAIYSFIFEGKRGLEALIRSKQLVSGNFWKVVWRSIFISIIVFLICLPFVILGEVLKDSHEIIDNILQLFLIPLVIFFEVVLFQNLVEIKQSITFQEPKKTEKFIYYLFAIIAMPLILGFTILQGLMLITHDIPKPDDSDLQLSAINIPEEQNSYYVLMEVKDKVYWPQEEIDKNGINDELSNKILQNNEQAMNAFERAVALPIFQQPELENPKNYEASLVLQSTIFIRNLAKANALKASLLFKQGREKEAFDQSLKTIKMGQIVQDGQGSLMNYLTGLAIKEIGLKNLRSLIPNSHLPSSDLLYYINELNKYEESKLALQKTLKVDYIMIINSQEEEINKVFRGEKLAEDNEIFKDIPPFAIRSFYYYKPNKTRLLFMETYRNFLSNAGKKDYAEVIHKEDNRPTTLFVIFSENAIGKILSNIIGVSFDSLFTKRFEENFSVKATQLLLALKAYEQDTGNLPSSLQDLIPDYIPELIQDPFDGKIIRYSLDKKEIYSTGEDLIDNGGSISESDWSQGDDVGFKINF